MFTRLILSAKFLRVYTCHFCKKQEQGTTERLELDLSNKESYTLDSRVIPKSGHNMPVGWGSFYGNSGGTVFRCGQCIKLLQGSGE